MLTITDDNIEAIINAVLNRMRSNVLLILTDAYGYHEEIYHRLSSFEQVQFHILVTDPIQHQHSIDKWQQLGQLFNYPTATPEKLSCFNTILLPFLDFKTVGDIANGVINDNVTELISYGLMKDIKIVALNYNCNPDSELNTILGLNKNREYSDLIHSHLKKITHYGVKLIDFNDLEALFHHQMEKISTLSSPFELNNTATKKYLTLEDIINKKSVKLSAETKLTDLAQDYIKQHHIELIIG